MGDPDHKNQMDKTRALVKTKDSEGFEFKKSWNVPPIEDDECQIKVTTVSICGSDINVWKWNQTAKTILNANHGLPFIPGHEAVGVVIKAGIKTGFEIGDR